MKVLIVDDSKVMRLMVSRTLRQAGFEFDVMEAESGVQAFETYQKNQPQLVLSDWNMPEMTGIELLEKLRVVDPKVRFGFVTSEGSPEMRRRAMDAGALFLITKPFTSDSFQQNLSPVIGPGQT